MAGRKGKFGKKERSLARRKEIWQEGARSLARRRQFRINKRSLSKGREVFQDRDKFVIVKKKRIASKEIEKFGKKCKRSWQDRREVC